MAPTRRIPPPNPAEPDTGSLAYWMGRVDANIVEMKTTIENFGRTNEAQWAEFETWRREVNKRLQEGSNRLDDHTRRIAELENGSKYKQSGNGNGRPKFGSWEWFRDSYLEKGIYIILSLALYKLIEVVIQYWANT